MCNITINHIVLVKDKTTRYSFDRDCSSPKKAVDVFNAVFGLEHAGTIVSEIIDQRVAKNGFVLHHQDP